MEKNISKNKMLLATLCFCILTSCSGYGSYQLTFNNQPVYTPPTIYNDFKVADQALQNCLTQTIIDQQITDIRNLRLLNCSYAGIENLDGLTHFKWLETINLSDNEISDIKPLMFLGQLQKVNLKGNNSLHCNDLDALEKFTLGQLVAPDNCLK